MRRSSACLPALLLSVLLVPGAAAVTVCVGTGEVCVRVVATAPGTTDADTVTISYALSSTVAPDVDSEDSFACGLVLAQGTPTRAGAGCASENDRRYVFLQESSDPAGPCVGVHPGVVYSGWCNTPAVSPECAGVWWTNEGGSTPYTKWAWCGSEEMTGGCLDVGGTENCGGLDASEGPCPDGSPGTRVSLVANGQETPLLCLGGLAAARAAAPSTAGLLP